MRRVGFAHRSLLVDRGGGRSPPYADWAAAVTRPFYAVGRIESSPATDHASAKIELKVSGQEAVSRK